MYRPRLKSKGGCVRCRKQRKKCDEARPTCSLCRRIGVPCFWSQDDDAPARRSFACRDVPHSDTSDQAASQRLVPIVYRQPDYHRAGLDPFHKIPFPTEFNKSYITSYLYDYSKVIIGVDLPFEVADLRNEVEYGLLSAALSNQAACYALLARWARHQARTTRSPDARMLSMMLENRTTELLRYHIEAGSIAADGVLLAAAVHYMSVALNVSDKTQLRRMICGFKALVVHCGGYEHIMATMDTNTILTIQQTDLYSSLISTDRLSFVQLDIPTRPDTFSSTYTQDLWSSFSSLFESDILYATENMKFLLYFRLPSKQTRGLSRDEVAYLHSLGYWVNYELCLLQHKYAGSTSISEIVVTGLIIMKTEVFSQSYQHETLALALLRRLRRAVSFYDLTQDTIGLSVKEYRCLKLWACFVATSGKGHLTERTWFINHIEDDLVRQYGMLSSGWPGNIEEQLQEEMQQFPWHSRLEISLATIILKFRTSCRSQSEEELQH